MVSLFITGFGYFAMLPMSDDPPKVALSSNIHKAHNAIALSKFSFPFCTGLLASDRTRNHSQSWILEAPANETLEVVGCRDPPQTWCFEVGRIFLFQYIIALILLSVGFSGANLMTFTIYSKILGPFPQAIIIMILLCDRDSCC